MSGYGSSGPSAFLGALLLPVCEVCFHALEMWDCEAAVCFMECEFDDDLAKSGAILT